jgi:ribose transport system substrate-binding protein
MIKIRFVCICLVLIFSITFAKNGGTAEQKVKNITIGLVAKSQTNPVFIAALTGARVAAKELGEKHGIEILVDWQTPQNENPEEQAELVKRLVHPGVDGIAISCSNPELLTPIINSAVNNKIEVMCFDSDAPKSKRFAFYGTNDADLGKLLAVEFARTMGGKGYYAISCGHKNAPNLALRIKAIREELKKYPGLKLVPGGEVYHEEPPDVSAKAVMQFQAANPQVQGWILVGGWALFERDALKWEPGQVKIVAADALLPELEYLKGGYVQTLYAQNCFLWGYKSVEFLLNRIISGTPPSQILNFEPPKKVTMENLDEWSLNWKKWLIKEAVYK